jgi:hypothetical protein
MGALTVPSDTDSEVAVSFSDGRHTPLPPIEGESEAETPGDAPREKEDEGSSDEEDDEGDAPKRRTQFFTPDPPASPAVDGFVAGNGVDEEGRGRPRTGTDHAAAASSSVNGGSGHGERLPSPPLQAVSA